MSLRNKLSRLETTIIGVSNDCFCGKTLLDFYADVDFRSLVPCRYCRREGEIFIGLLDSAQKWNENDKTEEK
jgi:hypothetical protein